MRFDRTKLAVLAALLFIAATMSVRAQQPIQAAQPANPSGWSFNVAPYIWLPTINASLNYNLPALAARLPTDISVPPAEYLPDLNFAAMFAAEARYERFTVLTDFIYLKLTAGASDTSVRSIDFFGLAPQPISRALDLGSTTTLKAVIWTLAGGYTLAEGDWGNFDLLVGFRFLSLNASTNYNLNVTLTGPRGNGATFGGAGSASANRDVVDGIGGFRGRFRLADSGLFIPYYFDIGAGGSKLTWQIASGLGYQTGWAGVSILGRYLSFEAPSSSTVRHLGMAGPMVIVNFSF
jgi:hypothetical protein